MAPSEISEADSRIDVEANNNKKNVEKDSTIAAGDSQEGALIDYKTLTWWYGSTGLKHIFSFES
jgi:hypothetical protein